MLRKMMVLAIAGGAMAALALPAASAASWKHHNTPISQNVQLTFTGNARFQGGLGGVECQVTASATFFANQTTGQLNSYGPHPTNETTNCKGLGGLAFCQWHDWTPTELPWTFHTAANNTIAGTAGLTHITMTGGFCPIKGVTTTPGTITITPNQPNTISSAQLSGSLQQDLETNNGTIDKEAMAISGTLSVTAPNANTYSI